METVITHPNLTPGTFQKIILEVLEQNNALQYLVKSNHYFGTPEPEGNLWIGNQVFLKLPEDFDTKQINKALIFNIQKMEELYSDEISDTSWEMIYHPKGYHHDKDLEDTPSIFHIDIDITLKAIYLPIEPKTATVTLKYEELDFILNCIENAREPYEGIHNDIPLYDRNHKSEMINKLVGNLVEEADKL